MNLLLLFFVLGSLFRVFDVQAQNPGQDLSRFQGEDVCKKVGKDLLHDADTTFYPTSTDVLVGAYYYYPWRLYDFHYGQGCIRKDLSQCPLLGEYDCSDPKTIGHHLTWSRQANIRVWVMSWWGPGGKRN